MEFDFVGTDGFVGEVLAEEIAAFGVDCAVVGVKDEGTPLTAGDTIESAAIAVTGDGLESVLLPLQPDIKRRIIIKRNKRCLVNLNGPRFSKILKLWFQSNVQ
jgi:hypothetical protein